MLLVLRRVLLFLAMVVLALAMIGLVLYGLVAAGLGTLVPLFLLMTLVYAWLADTYLRYRHARQQELLHVLATTTGIGLPLPAALRAYLHDRPKAWFYRFNVGMLLHIFVAPFYYFIWHKNRSFDTRIGRLADNIESGQKLSEALRETPALASADTRIAAVVGEESGQLAKSLRATSRPQFNSAWFELIPRLTYPLILLGAISLIVGYLLVYIIPRIQRIFLDFKQKTPDVLRWLVDGASWFVHFAWLLIPGLAVLLAIAILPCFSSRVRWYLPLVGRLYRWEIQGIVLRGLSQFIAVNRPATDALSLLAERTDLPAVVRDQLGRATRRVGRGEPLAPSLHAVGLLPGSMVPLVVTSERLNSLATTLAELGELQAGRAIRFARRASMILSILGILAVGGIVCFVVLAVFYPLVVLIGGQTP
ncbi:MAG: type II secretion system F family protein [Gemmataceae bacterium]|nr:type II secretion system F family protein [Gemmataceae bacterium]